MIAPHYIGAIVLLTRRMALSAPGPNNQALVRITPGMRKKLVYHWNSVADGAYFNWFFGCHCKITPFKAIAYGFGP